MSWADEERDVTAWLGNELQNEAFSKLYAQKEKIAALKSPDFDYVWSFMQTSDHFYYMATKWLSDGDVHSYFCLLYTSSRRTPPCPPGTTPSPSR